MKKILVYFFASCFCLYFLAVCYMYVNQRKFQYKPDNVSLEQLTILAKDKGFELVSYKNKENASNVMGLFSPPANNKKPLILFLNGNKGDLVRAFGRIMPLVWQGYGAYIVIYQGFSPNKGEICQDNLFNDAVNAYDFIKNSKKISQDKIIVYGYSLGTAVASFLAANKNIKALIIESGFSSMVDMAKVSYGFCRLNIS